MQEESGEARNNGNNKSKGKGKDKDNAEVENQVRDGSPVCNDPWDDLHNSWAVEISQSVKGGQGTEGTQQNQNQNHSQQQSGSVSASKRVVEAGCHAVAAVHKRHKSDATRSHPDFWYPDGSVIIEVENTKFRLHQTILQKKSAYFAAAFARDGGRAYLEVEVDAQSPNGYRLPVYSVVETTADDFAMLLTAIEDPMCVPNVSQMPVLAGVLRAARALSFETHLKWAEGVLERMWPAELDTLTTDPMPHAAVALAFARTCGLRGVQKRASYELLRTPTFWRVNAAYPEVHVGEQEDSRADADVEMGPDELLTLLYAREKLALSWAKIAGGAPTDFIHPCDTRTRIMTRRGSDRRTRSYYRDSSPDSSPLSRCTSASADRVHACWAELVHTTGLYMERMNDPLMGLQDLIKIPWREERFCHKCVAAGTNTWDEFRRNLWYDLDGWLQLADD